MACPRFAAAIFAAGLLTGCRSDFHFYDTIDDEFDFRLLGNHSAHLHEAYVVGARFTLGVDDAHGIDDEKFSGNTLRSLDEDVVVIENIDADEHQVDATVHAVGPGVVEIELVDADGSVRASQVIDVRIPDRVDLAAAAPLFLRRSDVDPLVDRPRVLVGGLATFQVRYFEGDTPLAGSGALSVVGPHSDEASVDETLWNENRDWLRVSPGAPGPFAIELAAGGEKFGSIEVEAVDDDAIADIELRGRNESAAEPGDWLVVIAQAFSDDGEPIFGIDFEWGIDGVFQSEVGDMYRYEYDPDRRKEATAVFADHLTSVMIHADDGYVDSSNEIGCSLADRRGISGWLALLLLGLRRRRRNGARSAAMVASAMR